MTDDQRIKLARIAAAAADLLEIVVFPVFITGALSPWNDAVDVITAGLLVSLLGWHWAFLPAFAAELVPFVTLAPTWSAAVYLATRDRAPSASAGAPSAGPPPPIDVTPGPPPRDAGPRG